MKTLTIFLAAFILTACGDSSQVKQVKNYVYDYIDSTLTVGNALDNRNVCNKTKWDSYKDERDRDIVEYTCEFKTTYSNQYLEYVFLGAVGNFKTQFIDKDINMTFDSYQKFKIDQEKNERLKYPNYTMYKNYIDVGAYGYIDAIANLMIYDKLNKALLEIENSDALARYQENREYLLSNKETIIKEIEEEEKYKVLGPRGYPMSFSFVVIRTIYGDERSKYDDGISSFNYFFSDKKFEGSTNIDNKDIVKRIEQIKADILSIKDIMKKNGLIFKEGYESIQRYMGRKIELLNLYNYRSCNMVYQFLLEGNSAKNVTLNILDSEATFLFNNYRELLAYFEEEENDRINGFVEEVIDPYNQNLTNEINRFEKLSKDIKTESYQQKIKWALIAEREPSLISCELAFKADGYSSVKSDSSMTSSCFQAAYKSDYVDQIYNQPVMNFINQVTR